MASTISGDDAIEIRTLQNAIQFFLRQPGPRILILANLGFLIARTIMDAWSRADCWVVIAVAISWHFQERLVHEYFLHMKARRLLTSAMLKRLSANHRQHHRDPWRTRTLLIASRAYLYAIPSVVIVLLGLTRNIQLTLTGSFAYFFTLLCYEWAHCLIHTSYEPRSEWYRRRWRNHRLHHFKNSQHWFGITSPLWDTLLGSRPDPSDIQTRKDWRGPNPMD